MKYFFKFLVFLTLLAACQVEERVTINAGGAYFPLQKGLFHVYSVHEVRYRVSEPPLESDYELMMEVVDSFPSGTIGYTYVIHRSIRQSELDPWQPLDTWSARRDANEVVVSEGNAPYVKMKFPVNDQNAWDGNIFNSLGPDQYAFRDVDQPLVLNGMNFEQTVTVEQEYNDDLIVFRDERKEIYALDVGLVYKEIIQMHYCTADACLGQQKVDNGVEVKMVISEYGKK